VPLRIAALVDLPDTVQKDVKDNAANAAGANSRDEFSDVPMAISRDLVAETQTNSDTGEPSWSVLGKLIEEEQFVVAVNYLKDSRNATEQDMGDEVKRILLLLKDHRYARFLESYGVNAYTNTARFYQIVAGMPIVDARGNMEAMITQLWKAWDGDGQPQRGSLASWQAFYGDNLTYPGMLEAWQRLSYAKWQYNSTEMKTALAEKFAKISPHSPQTLRLQIENTAEPSPEQLASWEKEAGDDPSVYVSLGERYSHFEQYQDAIRCYTQSIALSPSKKAFVGLADAYRLAGNDELWQPTLERFFQTEDLGLEHAMVHQLIAEDLIKKGKWEDAEPHALAAANTWSEWGLQLAADVYEALGRGDEAEKWEREASTSYPTFAGYEWYFYCRRSGAGDVNASRELAQGYFASDWLRSDDGGRNVLLVFDMLEDNKPAALADARYLFGRYSMDGATLPNRAYFHLELAYVARDAKDADAERQAMESVHRTVEALREPEPELSQVVQFVCDLFDGKVPSADARAAMEQHLASDTIPETRRCNYEYFLGRGYELADQKAVAIEYYRRAIALGHFNTESSTLAGMRLAALHASVKP
jgi:tetratricopeptide (TPR) repeat protein